MLTILHGENMVKSREALLASKQDYGNAEIIELLGNVDYTSLKQALESTSLFSDKRLVIIENLFSSKAQKKSDDRIAYIAKSAYDADVVLWEGKKIDGRSLVSFKKATIQEFKLDPVLFQFLDSIKPGNQHQMIALFHILIDKENTEFVFYMIVRQIRLLLADCLGAAIVEVVRQAPWQKQKLHQQAKLFTEEKLIHLMKRLFEIEYYLKRGRWQKTLIQELDILLATL